MAPACARVDGGKKRTAAWTDVDVVQRIRTRLGRVVELTMFVGVLYMWDGGTRSAPAEFDESADVGWRLPNATRDRPLDRVEAQDACGL